MSSNAETIKGLWTNYDPQSDPSGNEFRGIQRVTNMFLADSITDSCRAVNDIDTRLKAVETTIGAAQGAASGIKGLGVFFVQVIGVAAVMAPLLVVLIKYFVK